MERLGCLDGKVPVAFEFLTLTRSVHNVPHVAGELLPFKKSDETNAVPPVFLPNLPSSATITSQTMEGYAPLPLARVSGQ